MKWKGIFKLWHFWLFVFLWAIYGLIRDINYLGYNIYDIGIFHPVSIGIIAGGFVQILFVYTIIWLIFWRKKKQKD